MTPEQFVYWLQGFFEISGEIRPSPEEIKIIKEHLAKMFNKDVAPKPGVFIPSITLGDKIQYHSTPSDFGSPPDNSDFNDVGVVHYPEHDASC